MSSARVFVNHNTKRTEKRFISARVSPAEGFLPANWTPFRQKSDRQTDACVWLDSHHVFQTPALPLNALDVLEAGPSTTPLRCSKRDGLVRTKKPLSLHRYTIVSVKVIRHESAGVLLTEFRSCMKVSACRLTKICLCG